MSICDEVQRRLAEDGLEAVLADAEMRRHLESCAVCTRMREALSALDGALQNLPEIDAPDAVVADSLRAVRQATQNDPSLRVSGVRRHQLAGALAATVVIAASFGLTYEFLHNPAYRSSFEIVLSDYDFAQTEVTEQARNAPKPSSDPNSSEQAIRDLSHSGGLRNSGKTEEAKPPVTRNLIVDLESARGQAPIKKEARESQDAPATKTPAQRRYFARGPIPEQAKERFGKEAELVARLQMPSSRTTKNFEDTDRFRDGKVGNRRGSTSGAVPTQPVIGGKSKADGNYRVLSGSATGRLTEGALKSNKDQAGAGGVTGSSSRIVTALDDAAPLRKRGDKTAVDEARKEEGETSTENEKKRSNAQTAEDGRHRQLGADIEADGEIAQTLLPRESDRFAFYEELGDRRGWQNIAAADIDAQGARHQARAYLDRMASLDGLSFREATGYWTNSYIPGDPDMRLVQARLNAWDRRQLGTTGARLEQTVRPVAQLFDAADAAALRLYLHADTRGIRGPTRLRIQVGLKGAERQGGHRPAMNVGLVVDLRDKRDATLGPRIRALVTALERARQPGDRFSLVVAGSGGGTVIAPESFRHGRLKVAMARLFTDTKGDGPVSERGLIEAVSEAAEIVRQGDRVDAIQGASVVLLATGASLSEDLTSLEGLAHANAVGGVPMSVISLGRQVNPEHIDRLVAAGQGHRRYLASADEAEALIDRELHAASRAVARAVRLRIRLAPGVKLVDVLGSRRLEQPQVARVREAEQAIDQRLARDLGITADRGEDEEGIQIVIPNFYAGDSHVVLLDVVAERPGPVADVTARYKDVVYLKNGVAHAQLTIGSGDKAPGPLERNVLKNLLAWELTREMRRYVSYFEADRTPEAAVMMARFRSLIHGLRLAVPGWSTDPDLAADQSMLDNYLAALISPAAADPIQRRHLAESLRYAAFSKLHSSNE